MGNCKNCKHWGKVQGTDGKMEALGCEKVPGTGGKMEALVCELEPFDVRDMKADQCAVQSGHDGSIFCGPDYGCIHFDGRD